MKNIFKTHHLTRSICALVLVLSVICSFTLVLTSCNKDSAKDGSTETPSPTFYKAADSEDGYATVVMPSDRDIRILVLSDPQVDVSQKYNVVGSLGTDKTYAFIKDLVVASDADLVIINGDMVMSVITATKSYFDRYCAIFEELGVPWMPVFGNHDSETGFDYGTLDSTYGQIEKSVLAEYLSTFDHCLMTSSTYGDDAASFGYGNYFVNVRKADGSLAYTLCAFDCVHGEGTSEYNYVPTTSQVSWYRDTVNALSDAEYGTERDGKTVPSMIFNHVGIPEFKTAWLQAWNNGNPTEDYFYGRWFDGNYTGKYGDKPADEQIFTVAKNLGCTAIFMCHHHDNDFSVNYQGVRLTFGQHSGVSHNYRTTHSANGTSVSQWKDVSFELVDDYGNQRGGTLVTITGESGFDVQPFYAEEELDNFFTDYYIDYDAVAEALEANPKYTTGTVERGTYRKWKMTSAQEAA